MDWDGVVVGVTSAMVISITHDNWWNCEAIQSGFMSCMRYLCGTINFIIDQLDLHTIIPSCRA